MATTQDNRLLNLVTPLGKDYLLVNKFTMDEGLSRLFTLSVEVLREEDADGFTPTMLDPTSLLGQPIAIGIKQVDDTSRAFHGLVKSMEQKHRHTRFTFYQLEVVPAVWLLTQRSQSRIFQQKTIPEILEKVLKDFQFKLELQRNYEPRNYCVQYRESDFDFVSRLMEEEGIYYFFEHTVDGHTMIISDTPQSHPNCPTKSTIPYFMDIEEGNFITGIEDWNQNYDLRSGKVVLWDHNFELPGKKLESDKPSRFDIGGNHKLEIYDYPGGYSRKFDGIDPSGGERPSDVSKIFTDNKLMSEIAVQRLDVGHKQAYGIGNCASLTAGYKFKLDKHPSNDQNVEHIILDIRHTAAQTPDYVTDGTVEDSYSNSFVCITHGSGSAPYRPQLSTPKPSVAGAQTATVVGPSGEDIFTDKYGRVKVQFHWDREGKNDADSSCWVRVAQSWAGKKWGGIFIPRIGMEVIVDFLEADPDRPIITGCVYNAESMPPYELPEHKTKSTLKSYSTPGGGGFNELRFEDKKGQEQIFIHAEKDVDIRVKNDVMETIKHDRHMIIDNDQYEKVKKDKHLQVGGDQNEKVNGSTSLKVGSDTDIKVGSKYGLDAGQSVHIKAGMSAVIEAGSALTFKVGGNFINLSSAGIAIKGTMVMLNSGGASGSGAGANPDAPKDPKEADNAEPGKKPEPPKAMPPLQPINFSPMSVSLTEAAQSGAPFCEICEQAKRSGRN